MIQKSKVKVNRQLCIVSTKEHRRYFYLENGVAVDDKCFRLKDGLEIPCEEPKYGEEPVEYLLHICKNKANAETPSITDPENRGEKKELTPTRHKDEDITDYLRVYNASKNIGEIHKIVRGVVVETKFYSIINNQEVYVSHQKGSKEKTTPFPSSNDPKEELLIFNPLRVCLSQGTKGAEEGTPHKYVIDFDDAEITFKKKGVDLVVDIIEKIEDLSEDDKTRLKKTLSNQNGLTTLQGKTSSQVEYDEVKRAVKDIISTPLEMQEDLYKSIDPSEEFGISRFVSDRVYHLPELLREPNLIRQEGTNTYIVRAEVGDSKGNKIKFEHRFPSKSEEGAQETSELIIQRLQTVQHKIWLAAWQLANKLGRLTYTCQMTTLMSLCHPERKGYFSTKEKVQFYEDLRSLESTKIVFSKKVKKKGLKKDLIDDYEIRLLEIEKKSGTQDKYPSEVTLTILNPKSFQNQKMAFTAAGYKNRTLELHADDAMLAQVIQSRKSQRIGKKFLRFERDYLIEIGGLKKTNENKKSIANKNLLKKFKRLEDKGVIVKAPKKINNVVSIKIR